MKIYIVSWEIRSSYDRDYVVFSSMKDAELHACLTVVESYSRQSGWQNVRHRIDLMKPFLREGKWKAAWRLFESFDDDCVTIEEREVWEDDDECDLKKSENIARLLANM